MALLLGQKPQPPLRFASWGFSLAWKHPESRELDAKTLGHVGVKFTMLSNKSTRQYPDGIQFDLIKRSWNMIILRYIIYRIFIHILIVAEDQPTAAAEGD